MLSSVGSFSGIASGIQWRDLIDQMIALESRPITRLQANIDAAKARTTAWSTFQSRVQLLRDAANAAASSALRTNKVTLSGGSTVGSASATTDAAPGTHTVRVLGLASAETLGGEVFTSRSSALGLSGELAVNGTRLEIVSTDSLDGIARRFNDANAAGATGVTASVLTTSAGNRLVLSSTRTGAAGIDLVDGAAGVLRTLGVLDSTTSIKHASSSGAQSDVFTDAATTVAELLGFTAPPAAASVNLGGVNVTLDLATMSLADVASAINSAATTAGSGVTASVVTDGDGQKLDIRGTTAFTDANRILEGLGVLRGGRGAVAQQVRSDALGDGGAPPATSATLLTSLWSGGAADDVQAGDTLTLTGTRGDGSTFAIDYTIGAADSVQTLLDRLNSAVDGFKTGTRTATAAVTDGRIVVTDDTGGDSRLSLSIVAHNENGGTLDFGDFSTSAVGRARRIAAGADAQVEIDGSYVTSASNTITSAVPGLTLRLAAADPLTTMSVGVARDVDAGVAAIQKVVDTYNALAEFVDGQLAPPVAGAAAKPLHGDAVLRSMRSALRTSLNGVLDGDITGGLTRLPEIGIEIDRAGRYKVDATKLRAAVENSSEAVARLMGTFGTTSNSSVSFLGATDASGSGTYAVQITQAAAQAALTGAGFAATYVDDGTPDTLTVRDVGSDRGYAVSLSSGMTLSDIVNALNAQFALAREHVISAGAAFDSDVAGTAADDATAWSDLHIGGTNAGVATGDVLTISGTRPNGGSFLTSVVVSAGGTLGELRSAVQDALGSDVDVTWEDGVLTASAKEAGSALFTFTISSDNGGGGTLDFGGFSVTQQGRGTASIVASDSGGQLRLTHQDYGASVGFEVSFAAGGADGSASLGLATGTVLGANVAGTIGGFAATGTGRTLIGNAGTAVAGLKLSYDGAGTGAVGTLSFSRGLAAQLEDAADILLGSDSGSIRSVTERLSGSITRYESRITRLELRLDAREEQLIKRFTALEAAMATAQSQSAWLEAQLSQFQSSRQS